MNKFYSSLVVCAGAALGCSEYQPDNVTNVDTNLGGGNTTSIVQIADKVALSLPASGTASADVMLMTNVAAYLTQGATPQWQVLQAGVAAADGLLKTDLQLNQLAGVNLLKGALTNGLDTIGSQAYIALRANGLMSQITTIAMVRSWKDAVKAPTFTALEGKTRSDTIAFEVQSNSWMKADEVAISGTLAVNSQDATTLTFSELDQAPPHAKPSEQAFYL